MSHDEYVITFRAKCSDCGWDSDEQPNQVALQAAVALHHDLEVHPERLTSED